MCTLILSFLHGYWNCLYNIDDWLYPVDKFDRKTILKDNMTLRLDVDVMVIGEAGQEEGYGTCP